MQHRHTKQGLRLVTGMAALSLILAACHDGSSGTAPYLPASSTSFQQAGDIRSSCGLHIRIVLAGIVNCRFREIGDRNAVFTLKNDTHGLILISPTTGSRHTVFTITGLVIGSGHFTVHAGNGRTHRLVVTVRVTL
jgi:hypothetical protein